MADPRAYTDDEVRDQFLNHLARTVRYWIREDRAPTITDKMTGLVHSILATIDGSDAALPGFILAPSPHPDDEQFHRDEGERWYPRDETKHDIAGALHEQWHTACRRNGIAV